MNEVVLLATLLAQRGRVRSVEYSSFPAYDDLINAGLVEETGVVSSLVCDECDQPHDARVVYEGSQHGYYCPELGFVSKPRSELIAVQMNLGAFVSQIADTLDCKRRKSSPLNKVTWRIGAIESTAGDVVLYLYPTLQEARDIWDVQAALASEVKSPFGVILASSGTLTVPSLVTAQLDDVLGFEPKVGKFAVLADIRGIAGVPEQRTGGRPNEYEKPLSELIALRASQSRALKGRNLEAKAIIVEFKSQLPNIDCPSLPAVKRYVTKI
ncbi:MAG: hypothetical protein ACSHXW_19740 [Yoonia sp.]